MRVVMAISSSRRAGGPGMAARTFVYSPQSVVFGSGFRLIFVGGLVGLGSFGGFVHAIGVFPNASEYNIRDVDHGLSRSEDVQQHLEAEVGASFGETASLDVVGTGSTSRDAVDVLARTAKKSRKEDMAMARKIKTATEYAAESAESATTGGSTISAEVERAESKAARATAAIMRHDFPPHPQEEDHRSSTGAASTRTTPILGFLGSPFGTCSGGLFDEPPMYEAWTSPDAKHFDDMLARFQKARLHVALSYGSLLGAYRHHGTVPFDEDMDMGAIFCLRAGVVKKQNATSGSGDVQPRCDVISSQHLEEIKVNI